MNAMRAAVLPEPRAGHYLEATALEVTVENGVRTRPDLRLVHRADLTVAAPASTFPKVTAPKVTAPKVTAPKVTAPRVTLPASASAQVAFPVVAVPAATLTTPVRQRPAGGQPRASRAAPALRLTRRGRIVVAVLAALLVAALSLVAAGAAQAISHTGPARPAGSANLAQVVVQPGQSLWSVAESADPNADTRLVIQRIAELNSLNGDTVFAGQRLWVPRS
jgi:nucleoid-associated protein YgaU